MRWPGGSGGVLLRGSTRHGGFRLGPSGKSLSPRLRSPPMTLPRNTYRTRTIPKRKQPGSRRFTPPSGLEDANYSESLRLSHTRWREWLPPRPCSPLASASGWLTNPDTVDRPSHAPRCASCGYTPNRSMHPEVPHAPGLDSSDGGGYAGAHARRIIAPPRGRPGPYTSRGRGCRASWHGPDSATRIGRVCSTVTDHPWNQGHTAVKNRSEVPPSPTGTRTGAPHFGQRPT